MQIHLSRPFQSQKIGDFIVFGSVVLVFGALGVFLLLAARAATPTVAAQPELGAITAPAVVVSDGTASGQKAVTFKAANAPAPVPPPVPVGPAAPVNCLKLPSACGYPDATNTGVPKGTALKPSGSLTVSTEGAVIDALDVTGTITVKANNVTIKRTRITSGTARTVINQAYNLQILDSTLTAGNAAANMDSLNYTMRRCNVSGGADTMILNSNTAIYDSYFHDLIRVGTYHTDIMQTLGGRNMTVSHNTLMAYKGTPGAYETSKLGDPNNAVLMMGDLVKGYFSGLTFDNNLVNGGNTTFNANWNYIDANRVTVDNIRITNNRFGKDYRYGPQRSMTHGIVWSGNYYDSDLKPVNL